MDDFAAALEGARGGDGTAFAALWRWLHPALLRYLRVGAAGEAEDLASEVWLEVARGLDRFTGEAADFRGWVFTIARRRLIDWRRYAGRRPGVPVDTADLHHLPAADDTAAAALSGIGTEWALQLVRRLPPEQAELVLLRAVAGLDVATVARMVGKREGAVRVATMRALRRLAVLVEEAGVTR